MGCFCLAVAHKLLYARQDLKGTVMFLFEATPKGKNREPGLQENSVRSFTGRQILYCPDLKSTLNEVFFMEKWY